MHPLPDNRLADRPPLRSLSKPLLNLAVLAAIVTLVLVLRHQLALPPELTADTPFSPIELPPEAAQDKTATATPKPRPRAELTPPPRAAPAAVEVALPVKRSTEAEALMQRLRGIVASAETLTPRLIRSIQQILQGLAAEGPAGIPAIRDFLMLFEDLSFADLDDETLAGYGSLRLALIEILGQIGGVEAERVLADQLRRTGSPAEIAALADALEWLAPGQHQGLILGTARQSLTALSEVTADYQRVEAAPLFSILQDHGDAAELLRAPKWFRHYATVALANLPGDEGVPHLVKMLERPDALQDQRGRLALQLLAQRAVDNPDAEMALLEQVHADRIPAAFWPKLGEVIGGDHQAQLEPPDVRDPAAAGSTRQTARYVTHTISARQTQVIYNVHYSAVLPPWEIDRRLQLVDQLLAETDNPVAVEALHNAESLLLGSETRRF